MTDQPRVYFFGQWQVAGHYMWRPGRIFAGGITAPWSPATIDGCMQPGCSPGVPVWELEQPEGIAVLHVASGWSMISFWDRTGDKRRNSNGNFIIEGERTFGAMTSLAAQHFPEVWRRVTAPHGGMLRQAQPIGIAPALPESSKS
jgi:hypothetical protein